MTTEIAEWNYENLHLLRGYQRTEALERYHALLEKQRHQDLVDIDRARANITNKMYQIRKNAKKKGIILPSYKLKKGEKRGKKLE